VHQPIEPGSPHSDLDDAHVRPNPPTPLPSADHSRQKSTRAQKVRGGLLTVSAAIWLIRVSLDGVSDLLLVIGLVILILLMFALYVGLWTTRRHDHGRVYWRAPTQFNRYILAQAPDFANVHVMNSIGARMFSQGKAGGRLELQQDGLHWRAGSWTMAGINSVSGGSCFRGPQLGISASRMSR